jgi:hypothetical protein
LSIHGKLLVIEARGSKNARPRYRRNDLPEERGERNPNKRRTRPGASHAIALAESLLETAGGWTLS